jgi:hypothetical protein
VQRSSEIRPLSIAVERGVRPRPGLQASIALFASTPGQLAPLGVGVLLLELALGHMSPFVHVGDVGLVSLAPVGHPGKGVGHLPGVFERPCRAN